MKKSLSKSAYGGIDGKDYTPYVTDGNTKNISNKTTIIIGIILAAVFAASTAYSGMKAGLTVSAGIPGAILGSGLISIFSKKQGILGANILQGMSSGGEAVASGMIYVLPAIILIGSKVHFWQGVLVGIAAVLFAIGGTSLVQNYLLVQEHGKLIYPESMAISEALVASDAGGETLKMMGIGFSIGGIITALTTQVFGWINDTFTLVNNKFYAWKYSTQANPMLAGIGYVVGLDVALVVFAGTILANFAIVPLLSYFAHFAVHAHVWNNTSLSLAHMSVDDIVGSYTKYIGAGMMLCGGIIGAVKLIPTIINSIKQTINANKDQNNDNKNIIGILSLIIATILAFITGFIISKTFVMGLIGAILALAFSFLFIIVSARLAGTIGHSNNPISGMTIASLVIMTLVFLIMGWTDKLSTSILLLFGVFVVTAIAIASGYSQTQKVNFVIGGSNKEMMKRYILSSIVGVIVIIGLTVLLTPQLKISGSNPPFALPQANLIATLTSGIMSGKLPWVMIIAGAVMALVLWMIDIPIMTFALGFYLPISTTSIILIGALLRLLVDKTTKDSNLKDRRTQGGIGLSSGLIAGSSIIGLVGIILHVSGILPNKIPHGFAASNITATILLVIMLISILIPIYNIKNNKSQK